MNKCLFDIAHRNYIALSSPKATFLIKKQDKKYLGLWTLTLYKKNEFIKMISVPMDESCPINRISIMQVNG
jgi:hypothetical protein